MQVHNDDFLLFKALRGKYFVYSKCGFYYSYEWRYVSTLGKMRVLGLQNYIIRKYHIFKNYFVNQYL